MRGGACQEEIFGVIYEFCGIFARGVCGMGGVTGGSPRAIQPPPPPSTIGTTKMSAKKIASRQLAARKSIYEPS